MLVLIIFEHWSIFILPDFLTNDRLNLTKCNNSEYIKVKVIQYCLAE